MSDNSNVIHSEMLLFIRKRKLDQSSRWQAADSSSRQNMAASIHLSRQWASRGQQPRLMEQCLIWRAVFHHAAHNHTLPSTSVSCWNLNVTKTDDRMRNLFIFRAQNSSFPVFWVGGFVCSINQMSRMSAGTSWCMWWKEMSSLKSKTSVRHASYITF